MRTLRNAVICCLVLVYAISSPAVEDVSAAAKCRVSSVDAAFKNSQAVFTGKIKSVVKTGDVKTFTFEVEQFWKGEPNEKVEIGVQETMRYEAWFEVGESYLVYARSGADEDDGKLWEVRCSRSKPLADASEDVSELGRAKGSFVK